MKYMRVQDDVLFQAEEDEKTFRKIVTLLLGASRGGRSRGRGRARGSGRGKHY